MVEFSIITCSIDDAKYDAMRQCYEATLAGESFEIIRINDARGLAEGYSRGLEASNGRTVIFSHDDAAPLRPFAAKLRSHLRRADLVGGAGTTRLSGPAWFTEGPPYTFGQVLNKIPANYQILTPNGPATLAGGLLLSVFGVPSPLVTGIQAIDGFWFAAQRKNLGKGKIDFDPKHFPGFHFYDIDVSLTANKRGYSVGVATDLNLSHASTGGYNDQWKAEIPLFLDKWKDELFPERPRQFQFTSCVYADVNEALGAMDSFVAAAA